MPIDATYMPSWSITVATVRMNRRIFSAVLVSWTGKNLNGRECNDNIDLGDGIILRSSPDVADAPACCSDIKDE